MEGCGRERVAVCLLWARKRERRRRRVGHGAVLVKCNGRDPEVRLTLPRLLLNITAATDLYTLPPPDPLPIQLAKPLPKLSPPPTSQIDNSRQHSTNLSPPQLHR